MLGVEPAEPGSLVGAGELGLGRLGEPREVGGVPPRGLGIVAEPLGGVLAHDLEQAVALAPATDDRSRRRVLPSSPRPRRPPTALMRVER